VCVVVTSESSVQAVRKMAQRFRKRGQKTVHFTKERDSRRSEIISSYVGSGLVRGRLYFGKGNEAAVRDLAMRRMGRDLAELATDRVIIESRAGRDHRDRQALSETLRGMGHRFSYEHCGAGSDPGLWIADAFAWCYSAGGQWRGRISPVLDCENDLGECR
jgi:hypothetical protein